MTETLRRIDFVLITGIFILTMPLAAQKDDLGAKRGQNDVFGYEFACFKAITSSQSQGPSEWADVKEKYTKELEKKFANLAKPARTKETQKALNRIKAAWDFSFSQIFLDPADLALYGGVEGLQEFMIIESDRGYKGMLPRALEKDGKTDQYISYTTPGKSRTYLHIVNKNSVSQRNALEEDGRDYETVKLESIDNKDVVTILHKALVGMLNGIYQDNFPNDVIKNDANVKKLRSVVHACKMVKKVVVADDESIQDLALKMEGKLPQI